MRGLKKRARENPPERERLGAAILSAVDGGPEARAVLRAYG
jgi:hypothetical protein